MNTSAQQHDSYLLLYSFRYETPQEGKAFVKTEDCVWERDAVTYIDDCIGVHEMRNSFANQAVSLHLYVPPFDMCRKYDRVTAKATPCPMALRSVFGVERETSIVAENINFHCV